MAPINIFNFLQARQRGEARTRLRETQLTFLRLRERWALPHAAPHGSQTVKDIVPLGDDAFCLVSTGGRADAYAATPGTIGSPRWLTSLAIFQGERVRMAAHLVSSCGLLTIFSVQGAAYRGRLFARVLDVPAVLKGETRTRNCGSLSDVSVPAGGFIEFDDQNHCVWASDGQRLRCWDARSFQERFALGPWAAQDVPNVRFTRGLAGLMRPCLDGALQISLYDARDGRWLTQTEVKLRPPDVDFVFLELINECVLMKRRSCEVVVVGLKSSASHVIRGTSAWEPDNFLFLPSRHLLLALFRETLEIWSCSSPEFCCRLGTIRQVPDVRDSRFSVDEALGALLVVRRRFARRRAAPAAAAAGDEEDEELALLDLLRFGGTRAALRGACEDLGGGVGRVLFSAARGHLLLLGRSGGLTAYSTS
uniref:Uncharacterized protein n=1 Tax=Alexandrium monilatum TaxID=311494 RepID=A0A7S4VXP5_9DINO